jgi:CspA family cold shock protein
MADEQLLDRIDRMARERGISADDLVSDALDSLEGKPAVERPVERLNGSVLWFHKDKGFGFIKPDDGGPAVFVHHSALAENADRHLLPAERVSFSVDRMSPKGPRAVDVELLQPRTAEAPAPEAAGLG